VSVLTWTICKVATSSKKDTGPATQSDGIVLLLGVDDVNTSKQFYIGNDAVPFTDPDGFAGEPASA
jgi:hypothetical protein